MHEVVDFYNRCGSMNKTAAAFQISWQKVRKILISAGVYNSEKSDQIREMVTNGMEPSEIASKLKIRINTVNSYLPYSKAEYNKEFPSPNALKIRKFREKHEKIEEYKAEK